MFSHSMLVPLSFRPSLYIYLFHDLKMTFSHQSLRTSSPSFLGIFASPVTSTSIYSSFCSVCLSLSDISLPFCLSIIFPCRFIFCCVSSLLCLILFGRFYVREYLSFCLIYIYVYLFAIPRTPKKSFLLLYHICFFLFLSYISLFHLLSYISLFHLLSFISFLCYLSYNSASLSSLFVL